MRDTKTIITDAIMHKIITTQNNADKVMRFGVGTLAANFQDVASTEQIADAIETLLRDGHLTKLGAHTIGTGTGNKVIPYDLSHYDPFELSELKQHQGKAKQTEKPSGKPRPALKGTKKDQPAEQVSEAKQADTKPESKTTDTDADGSINYALQEMRERLSTPRRLAVKNLPRKVNALEQLADMAPPELGQLLNDIKNDLKGAEA